VSLGGERRKEETYGVSLREDFLGALAVVALDFDEEDLVDLEVV
jgi:hypothetical protein